MPGSTNHYGLTTLSTGDSFAMNGWKYTDADRDTIDGLLWLGAEGHVHTGEAGSIEEPVTAPTLELETGIGNIPASTRVYYKYSYVNERGEESLGSPEAFIDTPDRLDDPSQPVLSYATTGGIVQAGAYWYVLSSYIDASDYETMARHPNTISVPATTATNVITLTLPEPIDGQTGFNVYRRKPGQSKYFFLQTIDTSGVTPPTTFVDDGNVEDDCDRSLPRANTTNNQNSITISLPGATPTVPDGYTWKIYRTYVDAEWGFSFLDHVVENISEGSEVIIPFLEDNGGPVIQGSPLVTSLIAGSPSKISMTDMEEVQGKLPPIATMFTYPLTFVVPGELFVEQGDIPWRCPFPEAEILWVNATLGRDSAPAASDVIVDIIKVVDGATPFDGSIFSDPADRPRVEVGAQLGDSSSPDLNVLVRDDLLYLAIDQVGGGATPTDSTLVVTVYMAVSIPVSDSYEYSAVQGDNSLKGY